ncbi:MAG: FadR family transcriptional regulator [Myxococcales bacterium]|nr:FadR family transcriptional regulator [Myxococcales bacterium]
MVEPISRASDRVAAQLRRALLTGTWPVGARLPPERTLAETLGVNRLTLRAALAQLEAQGLIRARQGDGVRVLDLRTSGSLDLLGDLVALGDKGLVADLLGVRRAVAAEAVALAVARATPTDLAHIEALADLQGAEADPRAFLMRDLELGRAVVRAARSLPMELLMNALAPVYRDHPHLPDALYGHADAVRRSYQGVVALLRAGDPEAARSAVQHTLQIIDTLTLEALP